MAILFPNYGTKKHLQSPSRRLPAGHHRDLSAAGPERTVLAMWYTMKDELSVQAERLSSAHHLLFITTGIYTT